MKHLAFLLVLFFSLSGCTGFQHLHYRKVKKVPAKGYVEAVERSENQFKEPVFSAPLIDSSKNYVPELVNEKCDSAIILNDNKRGYRLANSIKTQGQKTAQAKKSVTAKMLHKKTAYKKFRKDHSGWLILLLLLLGLGLLAVGGTVFVIGFYSFSLLLVLVGIVLILLGLLPFLGMMSFIMGSRTQHNKNGAYKEQ
ncbi:MAG: hypothetical protein ABIQ40_08800 [Bacteroidia bacterium]